MAQHEHYISRRQGIDCEYVDIIDGRGSVCMPIDEFLDFAEHIAVVAAGAKQSFSQGYMDRKIEYEARSNQSPASVAERAKSILSALGIGSKAVTFTVLKGRTNG